MHISALQTEYGYISRYIYIYIYTLGNILLFKVIDSRSIFFGWIQDDTSITHIQSCPTCLMARTSQNRPKSRTKAAAEVQSELEKPMKITVNSRSDPHFSSLFHMIPHQSQLVLSMWILAPECAVALIVWEPSEVAEFSSQTYMEIEFWSRLFTNNLAKHMLSSAAALQKQTIQNRKSCMAMGYPAQFKS